MGIIEQTLNQLNQKARVRLAMPGHKGRIEVDGRLDMTELLGLDNLQDPQGILREAQDAAAALYEVPFARYLVNGSSSGNLTLFFTFFQEGDRVLLDRNCHRSVYHALMLRKITPVFLPPRVAPDGRVLPVTARQVEEALCHESSLRGVFLTLPTYSGFIGDAQGIHAVTQRFGVPLLLDAAHGAHLWGMPSHRSFYSACEALVMSLHKTLRCLNQGALILWQDANVSEALLNYSNMFQTSSPSYLLLASMERSLEELGQGAYARPPEPLDAIHRHYRINPPVPGEAQDPWKWNLCRRGAGEAMAAWLRDKGIYAEMHDAHRVLLMASPWNTGEELQYLKEQLNALDEAMAGWALPIEDFPEAGFGRIPERVYPPWSVGASYELLPLAEAVGRIAQALVIPYPPGVPLLIPGERISQEVAEELIQWQTAGSALLGISGGKIRVMKEEAHGIFDRH
ncbi:putative protein YaaO [Clostridiaceae bacterium JG1575]|nr:putative protein YaaO [Clostridiaceae bacterium JG1575]